MAKLAPERVLIQGFALLALAAALASPMAAADSPAAKTAEPAPSRAPKKKLKPAPGKPAKKAAAVEARKPSIQGEVAGTDVIAGSLSVRMGGGAMANFAVGEATKIFRDAEGKPAEPIPLEAVKIGEIVEVYTKDWKTADEIRVRGR